MRRSCPRRPDGPATVIARTCPTARPYGRSVNARVAAIHLAPGRRLPTKSVESVEAEAGVGLVGDRYHGTKHRHVTVQSLDDLAVADGGARSPDRPGLTRRNVTLDHGPIPTRPGERMRIGDVELEVVRIAAPCRLLDDWLGPGAMQALKSPRGGTVFRLLGSGHDPRRRRGRRRL